MNCLNQEIQLWEEKQYIKNMQRMYKTEKYFRDPRKKAFQDYRHHENTKSIYRHESKFVRYYTKRNFRRKLKNELYNEPYYRMRFRDYRTYGWITW